MRKEKILTFVLLSLISINSFAQNRAVYRSGADDLITIRKITLLPVFDNLRGIYSRPVETHLTDILSHSHRWDFTPSNTSGPMMTPDELEENLSAVTSISQGLDADAFIAMSISKGPSGITMKMDLFLKADQKLIAQESISEIKSFDVIGIKKQAESLMNKLFNHLPYSGMVLSRQGTRVTVNLGRQDGIVPDQILSVVQILKLVRHPKFNFLVSTEKEVIGKIKLLKIDDTLSFGLIITEKEKDAIQVNAKVAGIDNVVYPNSNSLTESTDTVSALSATPEGKMSFGENPNSWLPKRKPTFGMVGAKFGIGIFQENMKSSATTPNSLDSSAPFYPMVAIEGELWLTPNWSMHTDIRQGIISTDNPVSGGNPSKLSHSLSNYDFLLGYNLRLTSEVNAPKIETLFGYATYRLYVDDSTPAGLTTKSYSGIKLGVSGAYPLHNNSEYNLGANLFFMFDPKLNETPHASGGADNTVNSFGFFLDKYLSMNLKARGSLDFELYSSTFSGASATSSSQKHTTLAVGLYYLF